MEYPGGDDHHVPVADLQRAHAVCAARGETHGAAVAQMNMAYIEQAQGHYRRALALLPGCSLLPASANQPPTAYIDSITPAEATPGQTVKLTGHGTDADGQVVGYRWRSDRDGDLGRTATVETTSLSAGNHIIYFSVQWWNTLHQGASVSLTAAPKMAETMLAGMLVMGLAAWAYTIAAALHRVRSIILEREAHARWTRELVR